MIDKVKKNLTTGLTRVKWIAGFVAERTKAETSVAKMLYESSKLDSKIDELYTDVGKRVMELKTKGGTEGEDVFRDFIVQQALDEIKNLQDTVSDYRAEAKNINKLPE
jgi:gas vesicle protein